MKKLLLALLGLVIFAISLLAIWTQFPQLAHPQVTRAAITAALERETARQSKAGDPALNGYLAPEFLPFWGAPFDLGPSPTEAIVQAWKPYSTLSQGEVVDHQTRLSEADYLKARTDFENLLPALERALEKEAFVVRGRSLDLLSDSNLHLSHMRGLVQALSGLAESYKAEQRVSDAVAPLLLGLRLSHAIEQEPSLVNAMIAVALNRIVVDSVLGIIGPKDQLTPEQWKELSSALLENLGPENQLETGLEDELALADATFQKINHNASLRGNFIRGGALYSFPGMLAREERIYFNIMSQTLMDVRQGQRNTPIPRFTLGSWLQGRSGPLADNLLGINAERLDSLFKQKNSLLLGLGVSTALLGERARLGQFPSDLSFMKVPTEGLEWDPATAQLKVLVGSQALKNETSFDHPFGTEKSWMKIEGEHFIFQLR